MDVYFTVPEKMTNVKNNFDDLSYYVGEYFRYNHNKTSVFFMKHGKVFSVSAKILDVNGREFVKIADLKNKNKLVEASPHYFHYNEYFFKLSVNATLRFLFKCKKGARR